MKKTTKDELKLLENVTVHRGKRIERTSKIIVVPFISRPPLKLNPNYSNITKKNNDNNTKMAPTVNTKKKLLFSSFKL